MLDIGDHDMTTPVPKPIPLDTFVASPTFPVHALPDVLADMVQDVTHVTAVPSDLPALVGLGVIAAATARRAVVAIGRTHVEPLNLYIAAVAASGERKGPMTRAMLGCLYEAQRDAQQAAAPEVATAAERRRIAERRLERLRAEAACAKDPQTAAKRAADAEALARALPPVPVLPQLVVSDRTPEKLEQDLAQQGGALLLASEEAGTLFAIAGGRYARDGGAQLDIFLKAYDGGEIDTARITRGPVACEAPALSIIVTPQPYLLHQLRERPDFHHRGLLPRFLFAVPESWVGRRQHDRAATSRHATRQAYRDMIRRLLELPRPAAAAGLPQLRIEDDALDVWVAYHDRLEADLREGGRLRGIREWGSKQAGRVARIAGAMHLVQTVGAGRPWSDRIAAVTVTAASLIGEYLEAHALVAYDVMHADVRLDGARRVLAWIQRTGSDTFSGRDAFSALDRHRFPTMADFMPCLELLVQYGHLQETELRTSPGPGRRPSPIYHVHPESMQKAPQYPHKALGESRPFNCADIAETHRPAEPCRGTWGEV